MTDIYDQATQREELEREIALQQVRYSARNGPSYIGECLNCQVVTNDGARWCTPECRDDWQHRQNIIGNRNA